MKIVKRAAAKSSSYGRVPENVNETVLHNKTSIAYNVRVPNPDGVDYLVSCGVPMFRLGFETDEAAKNVPFKKVIMALKALVFHEEERRLYTQLNANMLQREKVYQTALDRAAGYIKKHNVCVIGTIQGSDSRILHRFSGALPRPVSAKTLDG